MLWRLSDQSKKQKIVQTRNSSFQPFKVCNLTVLYRPLVFVAETTPTILSRNQTFADLFMQEQSLDNQSPYRTHHAMSSNKNL